jgi:hypothetical protein
LNYAGSWPHRLPCIKPAQEHSGALARVNDAIANVRELAESGVFKDRAEQFRQRLDTLDQRRAELEAKP